MGEAVFDTWSWQPPDHWQVVKTIDTHTGGEPLRIVTSGLPPLEGNDVLAKRRYFMAHHDDLRRGLLREPRGHADMYGAVLTPAADDADFDVFFMNTEGYSPMCGHAVLAIAKVVVQTGLVPSKGARTAVTLNTPAGRNVAHVHEDRETKASTGGLGPSAVDVSFHNVKSFAYLVNETVNVPEIGNIHFDVAYGGAFYAVVDATSLGLQLNGGSYHELVTAGRRIKNAISKSFSIRHPETSDLDLLFGVLLVGPAQDPRNHSRNVNVFEDGEVDRSATGTGVSARAALLAARGELNIGQSISIESILGTTMTVTAVESTTYGGYDAIVPEVGGTAHIMGQSEFYFEPGGEFASGFLLR